MTAERDRAIRRFLDASGWRGAEPVALAGDASSRRYLRLTGGPRAAILMDAPDPADPQHPFAAMTGWLRDQGFSAPEILAADLDRGLLVLEDLGDDLYSGWLRRRGADEVMLYERAVDLLAELAGRPVPATIGRGPSEMAVPPYDMATLLREAMLLPEWWMPATAPGTVRPALVEEYRHLIAGAAGELADCRQVMVLRDYHADNLVWLPDRPGVAAVGLLDYQDVLAGHPAYDLVSLLEDARRDTSMALREAMIARYLARRPGLDAVAFRRACAVLGAQRNLKIVGIFARLALRDRKPRYLAMIPRVWGHLWNDLAHPALSDLRAWVRAHVPPPEPAVMAAIAGTVR